MASRFRTLLLVGAVIVVVAVAAVASYPAIRRAVDEQRSEQIFREKYSKHKDFDTIMKVAAENKALIVKNPQNDSAYYSLCQGYYALGALDEALAACRHAAELQPKYDYYWSFIGSIYQGKKDYAAAVDAYKKALELNDSRPRSHTLLAWLYYFRLKEKDRAIELLEAAVKKFPDDRIILFDIARYNLYLGRYEPFLEYAPRYFAVNPDDKEFRKLYDDIVAGARPVVPADEAPPGGEG